MNTKKTPIIRSILLIAAVFLAINAASSVLAQSSDRRAREAYEDAQDLLNDERYERAASGFKSVFERYDDSKYAGDAMYWYAFSLYRLGGDSNLHKASDTLEGYMDRYKDSASRNDASALYYRVLGELARSGDEDAASKLEEAKKNFDSSGHDMETKLMAMEALINMSSERAMPILRSVMANQSEEAVPLRIKAVFLLSQHESDESVDMLVDAAKNDADPEVREKAVFWLSQVQSDAAIGFLEDLVMNSDDPAIREKAVFAISQQHSERSGRILRDLAVDTKVDHGVREKAIFWLGQNGNEENVQFLTGLYAELDDPELKEKVIFSVSQTGGSASGKWILGIASDRNESMRMRKKALFWAAQQGHVDAEALVKLYHTDDEVEYREQVIFALSQSSDRRALDMMMDLARKETDPKLRKKLIFWIGQSNDPRAADFLVDIINE